MKTAVVTGASTGIGRAIAQALAKEKAHIFLIARNQNKLTQTQKLIETNGGSAEIVPTDLSSIESINQLVATIKTKTDSINMLINVAGIWHGDDEVYAGNDFETFEQQIILDTYTVGLTAPTLLAHALIPLMPENGKIINISGTFENGAKGWLPYYVSKRAIEDLTIGLSQELVDKHIQVNAISPSDTATEAYQKHFPQYLHETIEPEEIAKKIVELCSRENTTTGQVIVIKKDQPPKSQFHA